MKKNRICFFCGKSLGNLYNSELFLARDTHFRQNHPKEYQKYQELKEEFGRICSEFGLSSFILPMKSWAEKRRFKNDKNNNNHNKRRIPRPL